MPAEKISRSIRLLAILTFISIPALLAVLYLGLKVLKTEKAKSALAREAEARAEAVKASEHESKRLFELAPTQSSHSITDKKHQPLQVSGSVKVKTFINDDVKREWKSALHALAFRGDARGVETILEIGRQSPDDLDDDEFLTPMHYAAMQGHANVIRILIRKGACVEAAVHPITLMIPLHYAAMNGHFGAVQVLLQAPKVNHNALTKQKESPLQLLLANDKLADKVKKQILQRLLEANAVIIEQDSPAIAELLQKDLSIGG